MAPRNASVRGPLLAIAGGAALALFGGAFAAVLWALSEPASWAALAAPLAELAGIEIAAQRPGLLLWCALAGSAAVAVLGLAISVIACLVFCWRLAAPRARRMREPGHPLARRGAGVRRGAAGALRFGRERLERERERKRRP